MANQRVTWIDISKYICIMCVMNSHLESSTPELRQYYTPFFLSLFFFCSGYVYRPKDTFLTFAKKKVKQLFLPWLIFSVLNIFLSQIITFNEHNPISTELFWNFMQIRGIGDGLWFVAALFVAFFPFYFLIHWYENVECNAKTWLLIGISWLLSAMSYTYAVFMNPSLLPWNSTALPWHLEYIFIAIFYMVLGYLFRTRFEPIFDKQYTIKFRIFIWVAYLGMLSLKSTLDFSSYYLINLLGVAAVISLSKTIPINRMILYIGQNTLICFALHGKIYSLLQTIFKKVIPVLYSTILGNTLYSSLFSIVFTVLISIILIAPIWIINHWFPFMLGRSYKTNQS